MKPVFFSCVLIAGTLFGYGLSWASMIQPEVVLSFLRFEDFGLLFVLGAAALVTLISYQLAPRFLSKPLLSAVFGTHPSAMNSDTLFGACVFGVGWGISGVCPGPAIAGLGAGNWPLAITVLSMFAGAYVQGRLMED